MTNIRNSFNRLASGLIAENKRDSAIAVLDRCQELVPASVIPYEYFGLEVGENYIRAGAKEKAIALFEDAYASYDDELNYFFSLKPELLMSSDVSEEIQRNLFYLQKMERAARNAGETELADKYGKALQTYFDRFRNA